MVEQQVEEPQVAQQPVVSLLADLERSENRPALRHEDLIQMTFNEPLVFRRVLPLLGDHLKVKKPWQAVILAVIKKFWEQHEEVPTRAAALAIIRSRISVEHAGEFEEIEKNVNFVMNPIDVKHCRAELVDWLKRQMLTRMLSSEESLIACEEGDDVHFREILENVSALDQTEARPVFFSKDAVRLLDEDAVDNMTCGFPQLDPYMNRKGPARGEICCFMGRTGIGKSNVLCNAAVHALTRSFNVGYVTLELHTPQVAQRLASIIIGRQLADGSRRDLADITIGNIVAHKDRCVELIHKMCSSFSADISILDLPGKTLTADGLASYVQEWRRGGFPVDILIVDYLDELLTKNSSPKDGDYGRLKHISSELRSLAASQNVLLLTATQINRAAQDKKDEEEVIDLERTAESWGKNHSLDYVISLNQTKAERTVSQLRLFVVKNRNGRPYVGIRGTIDPERLSFNFMNVLDGQQEARTDDEPKKKGAEADFGS